METLILIKFKPGKSYLTPIYPRPVEVNSKLMYWEIRGVDEPMTLCFSSRKGEKRALKSLKSIVQ